VQRRHLALHHTNQVGSAVLTAAVREVKKNIIYTVITTSSSGACTCVL
jgi:hypothetical protein